MADTHYDLIVTGSGPRGGVPAQRLAPVGEAISMLERGDGGCVTPAARL